ncbi:IroC [Escherichia coli]|nr:IroC [Escherichia coli]
MFAIAATMFWLDPFLALTALSTVPVAAMATMIYRRLSTPSYAQARAKSTSTLQEKSPACASCNRIISRNWRASRCARYRSASAQLRIPLYSIEDWQQLSRIVNAWQQATASGKHIDELLATEGTEDLGSSSLLPVTGALHLDEVTFSYPASHEPALNKLTLTIPEEWLSRSSVAAVRVSRR